MFHRVSTSGMGKDSSFVPQGTFSAMKNGPTGQIPEVLARHPLHPLGIRPILLAAAMLLSPAARDPMRFGDASDDRPSKATTAAG